MRAITVRQPWAFAIVVGAKTVENRTWRSRHVGPLAIHAARREDTGCVDKVLDRIHAQLGPPIARGELRRVYEAAKRLGCVVGTVDMTGCTDGSDAGGWERPMRQWWEGPHGFVLENPRAVTTAAPCRGRLGIWRLPEGMRLETVAGRTLLSATTSPDAGDEGRSERLFAEAGEDAQASS